MTQETIPEEMDAAQESVAAAGPDLPLNDQEDMGESALPQEKDETLEPESIEVSEEEPTEVDVVAQLESELAEAQAQADEYLDQLQRTAAEFQNSRRRQERQLSEEIEHANGNLIKRLLPVLDDMDLAFDNMPASAAEDVGDHAEESAPPEEQSLMAWVEGFRQIQRKLLDVLAEEGVNLIETEGQFDPMQQEAISSEPNDGVESGNVIECLRAGYEYKGRVLRPALVRVAL